MADYSVNLELAIKGAKDLQKTRVETKRLVKEINFLNKNARQVFPAAVKNFNNLSKEVSRANRAVSEAAIGTDHYRVAIKNAVKVEEQFNKQLANKEKLFKIEKLAYKEGISFSQAKSKVIQQEIKAENELARARLRSSGIGAGIRRGVGSAVGSGIIGGGFPLLFGQGPVSALGGAVGGIAGGALSAIPGMGQFGFALSIAGTAIGSAMEDLTQALEKPTENIENLVGKLGLVGTPTGDLALELEKMGLKSSAAKLLLDQFNEKLGVTPDGLLATSEQLTEFKNKINELGTVITIFLGKALTPFINSVMNNISNAQLLKSLQAKEGTNFSKAQQAIVDQSHKEAQRLFPNLKDTGKTYTEVFDERLRFNLQKGVGMNMQSSEVGLGNMGGTNLATQTFQDREIKPLKQALEIEKNRLTMSSERLNIMKEEFKLENLKNELKLLESENEKLSTDELTKKINKLKVQVDLQGQVVNNAKALIDPFKQLSDMIQIDMGNGIKDLIKGTQTLNDVMRNMLDKMADAFLNLAIFGNIGGGSITGGLLGAIFKRENGGPVKAGGSYIVGERGPEMFSPGVSGMITPNHALGGGTTVIVNVDASGSSVEGDEQQGRELGRLISVAVQSELVQQKRPGGLLA